MAEKFGPKWCFHHRDRIQRIDAPNLMFTAVNQDGKPMEPVNLASYQALGRVAVAKAFAKANRWTEGDSWVYLYGQGTVLDSTSKTNEAIRQQELAASAASAASAALSASAPGETCTVWDDGDVVKPVKVARFVLTGASHDFSREWERWGEERRLERVALEIHEVGQPF
jgi:hypothetical protein